MDIRVIEPDEKLLIQFPAYDVVPIDVVNEVNDAIRKLLFVVLMYMSSKTASKFY